MLEHAAAGMGAVLSIS
ncbi:MAG: hypothetical protein ACO2ZQ_05715 [Candidatus Puniceispirillaceae bacterium]